MTSFEFVDYANIPPPVFDHKIKIAQWNPQGTYNQSVNAGDIVRFNIQTEHFWDPYSAYLEVVIDVSNNSFLDSPGGVLTNKKTDRGRTLQVDSSAHSLFSQMIIYEQSEELERIMHMDTLCAILKDMDYNTETKFAKDYEGLGGLQCTTPPNFTTSSHDYLPGTTGKGPFKNWKLGTEPSNFYGVGSPPVKDFKGTNLPYSYAHAYINSQTSPGIMNDVSKNRITYDPNSQAYMNNFSTVSTVSNGVPPDTHANGLVEGSNPQTWGPAKVWDPAFGVNGFEPFLSKSVPQRFLKNGFVHLEPVSQMTFYIPLMSGIFGHLVSPNRYKLIPMKFFKDLIFEFQFNPHFLFSSWHDVNQARNYTVKNLVMHASLIEIRDQSILTNVDRQYQGGIQIPCQSFYLGPLQSISNGAIPPTVQVNLGFESLRNLLFCFIPNDYAQNAKCRKQYRLSMGLNHLQVKIGTDYYPQLAIKGNGGNNIGTNTNYDFIRYLYECFGKKVCPTSMSVNPHNFAVNFRESDPNVDDDGDEFLYENRVIGKALYGISLDGQNYANGVLSGVNTTNMKPFEIQMGYNAQKTFNRNVTMITFCHYDFVLTISPQGIKSIGKS